MLRSGYLLTQCLMLNSAALADDNNACTTKLVNEVSDTEVLGSYLRLLQRFVMQEL